MKGILLIVISCAAFLYVNAFNEDCEVTSSHDYAFGSRVEGDSLLYSTLAKVDGIWFLVRDNNVSWPLVNQISEANITQISVTNRLEGDDGGCAVITEGGPGSSHVSLQIYTQRSLSAKFLIQIYGFGY